MEPICIVPAGDVCGEAVLGRGREPDLLDRYQPLSFAQPRSGQRCHAHPLFDQPVVALSLDGQKGCLLVALGSQLILFNPESGTREIWLPP